MSRVAFTNIEVNILITDFLDRREYLMNEL